MSVSTRFGYTLPQLFDLSRWISIGANSAGEQARREQKVKEMMALCGQHNVFRAVRGGYRYVQDAKNGLTALRSIIGRLHRRWRVSAHALEQAQKKNLFLVPIGSNAPAALYPVMLGEPLHRNGPLTWHGVRAEMEPHTGAYVSGSGTMFFWEWKPVLSGLIVSGGGLELVGHMSDQFADKLPTYATVQKDSDTAVV